MLTLLNEQEIKPVQILPRLVSQISWSCSTPTRISSALNGGR